MVAAGRDGYPRAVPDVVVAADEDWVREEVCSVLSAMAEVSVREARSGPAVLAAAAESQPDLVVLDMQIGSMGAVAICLDLRLEEGAERLGHVPVLILLDRRADVFLARRCDADGWLLKPLDPIRVRRAVRELLAGRKFFDDSYRPAPA
jgi:DNA-binding NarL/FixJ family response regulator